MLEPIIQFIIMFLAVYGFFSLFTSLAGMIQRKVNDDRYRTRLAILVKDQEETIEGIIRTIFMEHLPQRVLSEEKLFVIDMGSQDSTLEILSRLNEEYRSMDVLNLDQKYDIFEKYEQA